ncbi:MAG TPA: ArsA-related P-loop ATPase [Myxococcales bacterium]|jgi:anion-transporting  ArsA/GET3 family ATPase
MSGLTGEHIGALLRDKRIIVCCGAGGVGKTTTAAALSLAAARAGRKVLVLTIDPSRRLAETLGVSQNPPAPVPLPAERAQAAGIAGPGSLHAWLLNPKIVADDSVRRLIADPAEAQKLIDNRIYQQVSTMVAGMHEYTAMEALHRLMEGGGYELVVLDTPPSRNALDFLEAPGRLARLLDMKVFKAFLPRAGGLLTRAASKIIEKILSATFGAEFAGEFTTFLTAFSGLFGMLNLDVSRMRAILGGEESAFLLVCSPAPAAIDEVLFFREKTRALGLPFKGFVLNRTRAGSGRSFPGEQMLQDPGPEALRALEKLQALARSEQAAAGRDEALLASLTAKAGAGAAAIAVPDLPSGADDMATLLAIADLLARR